MFVDVGDGRARRPASESALRPLTTEETPPLPMAGLRPVVVSRPTLFALVRQDDFNEPSSQHECALNKEHAESPEHAQPAHGKGAFELIPDSGNRSPLLSVELPDGVNRTPDPTDRGMQ